MAQSLAARDAQGEICRGQPLVCDKEKSGDAATKGGWFFSLSQHTPLIQQQTCLSDLFPLGFQLRNGAKSFWSGMSNLCPSMVHLEARRWQLAGGFFRAQMICLQLGQ
jgi:hypothetical protein